MPLIGEHTTNSGERIVITGSVHYPTFTLYHTLDARWYSEAGCPVEKRGDSVLPNELWMAGSLTHPDAIAHQPTRTPWHTGVARAGKV